MEKKIIFKQNNKLNDSFQSKTFDFYFRVLLYKIFVVLFFLFIIWKQTESSLKKEIIFKYNEKMYDINFDYSNYERNIVNKKMIKNAEWQLNLDEAYFINGLIRKNKPKSCLEIGVASGGSSVLILNAIKDFINSSLVSLDLYTQYCKNHSLKTGYKVNFFPELINKWKLYTGDLPSKFLDRLNMKFDFAFIDSAHESPG